MRFFKKTLLTTTHISNSIHIKPFFISAYFIQPLKIHIFFSCISITSYYALSLN